jgi:hypothetical protein
VTRYPSPLLQKSLRDSVESAFLGSDIGLNVNVYLLSKVRKLRYDFVRYPDEAASLPGCSLAANSLSDVGV